MCIRDRDDASVIEYRDVTKRFGPFNALSGVSFTGCAGSVHAVTGENGAGKSTLMKLLAGVHAPSAGEIYMDGVPLHFDGADKARAAGIATVFQELTLLENLTIAENLFLGREPRQYGMISGSMMRRQARVILDDIGIDPVSYTHLDVYKRQSLVCANIRNLSIRKELTFVFSSAFFNQVHVRRIWRA